MIFPDGSGLFQQDNAPCHTAEIVQEWFDEHDKEVKVLPWPSNSPDLNSTEHLWDVIDQHIWSMAATVHQNAHHTPVYWWRGDRAMKPNYRYCVGMIRRPWWWANLARMPGLHFYSFQSTSWNFLWPGESEHQFNDVSEGWCFLSHYTRVLVLTRTTGWGPPAT